MAQIKSWEVSDELWAKIAPLVPIRIRPEGRAYLRKPGGGRKPLSPRQVFGAIVYVLRTGCQWKALPRVYGSASAVHKRFQEWQRAGFSSPSGRLDWRNTMEWMASGGNGKVSMAPWVRRHWR